jgi:hypothetical protein
MILTGKAKEKFEEWFRMNIPEQYDGIFTLNYEDSCYETVEFYDLPESMQFGVYQDWADSLGYYFDIEKRFDEDGYVCFGNHNFERDTNTRQEARNAAIEKLNELINER